MRTRPSPIWIARASPNPSSSAFQTCYDCLWKVLKRYLAEELGVGQPPIQPQGRSSGWPSENDLLASPIARWFRYVEARIDTSHDYDGEKAQACLALVPDFIDDAIGLYQTMSGATWE